MELWLRANWQGIVVGVILGMLSLFYNKPNIDIKQTVTTTATATAGGVIKIPGRAATATCPECPPIEIRYDCGANVANTVTQTVAVAANNSLYFAAGGGYKAGILTNQPGGEGIIQVGYGAISVYGHIDTGLNYGAGVMYRF